VQLFVFDGYKQVGAVVSFSTLEWVRRYNAYGEFTLKVPFTAENYELLAPWRMLYHRDTKEAGVILGRNVVRSGDGTEEITVTGPFLSEILRVRTYRYTGVGRVDTIVNGLVSQALITAANANRVLPGLRIGAYDIPAITVDLAQSDKDYILYELVNQLALQYDIGFAVDFLPSEAACAFRMYKGRDTNVVFAEDLGNVLDQDYFESRDGYRNTCVIGNVVVGDANAGLRRREATTTSNAAGGTVAEQGALYLQQFPAVETFDAVINDASAQFVYMRDWDLGDAVTFRNRRYGLELYRRIVEVKESYDLDARHISVLVGDPIPTARQIIRR